MPRRTSKHLTNAQDLLRVRSADKKVQFNEAFSFLFVPSRYKACHGGRGGGKSHAFALALLLIGRERPIRVLCAREIQTSIKDSVKLLLDDYRQKIDPYGEFYHSTNSEITGANGTLFVFAGLRNNPDSVKSMEGLDFVWVEEANRVSKKSLRLLIPTVRKPGSELWFNWNRDRADDPVDEMFLGPAGPPPNSIVRCINYDQNPWFSEELRAEMEYDKLRDYQGYLHTWEGQLTIRSDAQVFTRWEVDDTVQSTDEDRIRLGADWGFSTDPTTLVRIFFRGRKLYIEEEAYALGCEIDDTPELFDTVSGSRKWPIIADSARPETISYMRRHGFSIRKATKGQNSVHEGVKFLQSYDIKVHPRCKHVIKELSTYSYKIDKQTEEVLPELRDENNNMIDAIRYAAEADRRMRRKRRRADGGALVR